jgi:hypothetical protein
VVQPLSKSEVHQLMSLLSAEQKAFIDRYSKQSKKSKWIEAIARRKGIVLSEDTPYEEIEPLVEDWVLVDVLDSGYGNRDYSCECGRSLRYQYRVLHKEKGKVYGYGSSCFEHHTNLCPDVVKDIKSGFHSVDLERDEILIKYFQGDGWSLNPYLHVDTIPGEMLEQSRLELPFTERQRSKIMRLVEAYERKKLWEKGYGELDAYQKEIFLTLAHNEQWEVIRKVVESEGNESPNLPADFQDGEVLRFYSAGLPLLQKHLDILEDYRLQQIEKKKRAEIKRRINDRSRRLQYRMVSTAPPIPTATMDYTTLIERHLDTLKSIRENEHRIPEGLKKDWITIEQQVRDLKKNQAIDYSSFKVLLNNLCYALQVRRDGYL